jgi:FkbM family methyltransferase
MEYKDENMLALKHFMVSILTATFLNALSKMLCSKLKNKKMYSTFAEDIVIHDYWKTNYPDSKGTLVDIGAKDGISVSNSYLLIQTGWRAYLFEPSKKVFEKLFRLHAMNPFVSTYNCGLSDSTGLKLFNDKNSEKKEEVLGFFYSWKDWLKLVKKEDAVFDFISIDSEREDWEILTQMDLTKHNCKVLAMEWNNNPSNAYLFTQYANSHHLSEIYRNEENIIFVK